LLGAGADDAPDEFWPTLPGPAPVPVPVMFDAHADNVPTASAARMTWRARTDQPV
jgi:hypothetical protein